MGTHCGRERLGQAPLFIFCSGSLTFAADQLFAGPFPQHGSSLVRSAWHQRPVQQQGSCLCLQAAMVRPAISIPGVTNIKGGPRAERSWAGAGFDTSSQAQHQPGWYKHLTCGCVASRLCSASRQATTCDDTQAQHGDCSTTASAALLGSDPPQYSVGRMLHAGLEAECEHRFATICATLWAWVGQPEAPAPAMGSLGLWQMLS